MICPGLTGYCTERCSLRYPCSREVWQTGLPWILFTGVFGAVNCPASRIKGNGLIMRDICFLLPAKTPQGVSTGIPRIGITRVDGDYPVIRGYRFGIPAKSPECNAAVVPRFGVLRGRAVATS